VRKLITTFVLGFSYTLAAQAGDGRAVEPTFFGVIVSSSLAVTLYPVTTTEDSQISTRNSSNNNDQKIIDARNDAAAFVASNGDILGVELQAAFSALRATRPVTHEDDMQLAVAILAYQPAD